MALCERVGALRPDGWSGDLRDFVMAAWAEDSDLAGTVVVRDHVAHGWVNLRHVHQDQQRLVWMRLRSLAARRPPLAMIWAHELAALLPGEHAQEA